MKKKIIFASNNQNKIKEIKDIIKDYDVISLKDAGIDIDIIESGKTFEENALIKAKTIADLIKNIPQLVGTIVLADDSGLEIDYLEGAPGIYSARWKPGKNDYEVNEEVIEMLKNAKGEERAAHYTTVIACVLPNGEKMFTKDYTHGIICDEQRGTGGFAYDPIFYIPEFKCTMAEMSLEQKNAISHRGNAIKAMQEKIANI